MSDRRKIVTSFDSVVLSAVGVDLEPYVGGRIVRVVQPSSDEIVLEIKRGRTSGRLLASIHAQWARVHLTQHAGSADLSPFAQMLRRRIDRGVLRSAQQPPFERTLTLDIETDSGPVGLVIEIMGRHSNMILVENARIAGSLKTVPRSKSSVREIRPGRPFVPAPSDRPTPEELTPESLAARLAQTRGPLAKALASSMLGVGPALATELVHRSGMRPDELEGDYDSIVARLWPHLQELVAIVKERRFIPTTYWDDGAPAGFAPFPYLHLESMRHQRAATMSDAVNAVLTAAGSHSLLDDARTATVNAVDAALAKVQRTEEEIMKSLAETDGAEDLRVRGELLLAYATQIEPGATEAHLASYDGTSVIVPLDPELSPVENAQSLFKRYGKLRDARPALRERQNQLSTDRIYLEGARALALAAATQEELDEIKSELADEGFLRIQKLPRKDRRGAGPRTFKLSGGTVLVGRTNRENDRLTFTLATPEDLWFHARGVGAAHVVLKTEGKRPSANLIAQAASIAAYFSQARNSGQVPVDYTSRKYVRKPKGARPGLVTYEREKTILAKPELPITG